MVIHNLTLTKDTGVVACVRQLGLILMIQMKTMLYASSTEICNFLFPDVSVHRYVPCSLRDAQVHKCILGNFFLRTLIFC